jgi:polyisoprenoid-binding protein YceI
MIGNNMKQLIAVLAFVLFAANASANSLKLDPTKSSIGFSFSQLGVPLKGKFTKFDATLFFDAKKLEATKAEFGVDLGSVDLGDKAYNDETKSAVWLNAGKFPRATFVADKVVALGGNKFEAVGSLAIKGVTQPIKAQFSVTEGAAPVVEGVFTMKRLGWKIGDKEWSDTSVVADDVKVTFKFVTSK